MKDKIMKIMTDLVAFDSISDSKKEVPCAAYIYDFLSSIPYFKDHPEDVGLLQIPGDAHGRTVPYAFLKGNNNNTVVMMGHFDVVNAEVYGEAEGLAFTIGEELEAALAKKALNPVQRADMESGEWIWGRGAADMKGGLAIHMALFEQYAEKAQKGELAGSLFFMAVPDEESYSAGMRAGAQVLREFKRKYDLDYKLLVDPEPTNVADGKQIMSIGSVGKCMPVVMVQGVTAHVGMCFNGISPLGILSGIYLRTNGSLEFSDCYEGEATMPPTWTNLRDMKEIYDVSIPYRASGYFTVLSFSQTPDQILAKLRKISEEVFEEQVTKLNDTYQEFKKMNKFESREKLHYDTLVMSFAELIQQLKDQDEAGFAAFYKGAYEEIAAKTASGELNYPSATIALMDKVLNYADIKQPLVLLGFAPPYYPAVHSDLIAGKEGAGTDAYNFVKEAAKAYGQEMNYENYFMGISDASYSCMDHPFDYNAFSTNTPMWGDLYSLDFEAIEEIGIPAVIYGPIGKEYHQWTERVNKKSLLEVVPAVTQQLLEHLWAK
ncbi:MAG: M20/M25/M40 family metallo-hydrolase [Firmicutes bacterium]|nr:M20/M25/M40 family metallo-hydrolase [Bacillota bacterium]